jgi:hypothetical protein
MFRRGILAQSEIEKQLKMRRYVDDQFPKIEAGLENALHHYRLLQENHEKLLQDYKALSEKRPLRRGAKAVRHLLKMLRDKKERHSK